MRLELSPSGRATCRTCETRIERGVVRVAETLTQHDHTVERYHHLVCLVEDQPNGAIVAMLAAAPELRTAAEQVLSGHQSFLATVARAAATKTRGIVTSDEFDEETEGLITKLAPNPRDPALLSVLQDHLQERGLPRGELIALELAKAPETARLVELKRQLWPAVKDIRVTWGAGFLRTMNVVVRDQQSAPAATKALQHPSARLLEELALQGWVGPLPSTPPSLRRLELQWGEGTSASVEALPRLQHLQLDRVEDADRVRSQSLTSIGFGPDVVAAPLAQSVPQVRTVVFESRHSINHLLASGLLRQARVIVLTRWDEALVDALTETGLHWEQLVFAHFRPNENQRVLLKGLARRSAVRLVSGVSEWVAHTSRPEWGVGRVRARTATSIEVEFESGVRTFPPGATVLIDVELIDDATVGSS